MLKRNDVDMNKVCIIVFNLILKYS